MTLSVSKVLFAAAGATGSNYGISFFDRFSQDPNRMPVNNNYSGSPQTFVNGEHIYIVRSTSSSPDISVWAGNSTMYYGWNTIKMKLEDNSVVWDIKMERDLSHSVGERYLDMGYAHGYHFDSSGNLYMQALTGESSNYNAGYYSPYKNFYDSVKLDASNGSVLKWAHIESIGRPLTSGNSAHNGEFGAYECFCKPQNPNDGPTFIFGSHFVTGGQFDSGWGYHYFDQNLDTTTDVTYHVGSVVNSWPLYSYFGAGTCKGTAVNLNPNTSDIVAFGDPRLTQYKNPSWYVRRVNRSTQAIVWEHCDDRGYGGYSTGYTGISDQVKPTCGCISPTNDTYIGGWWLTSVDHSTSTSTDRERPMLVKYNASGTRVWEKCIDSQWSSHAADSDFRAASVIADDTHVYMCTTGYRNITNATNIRGFSLFCWTHAGVLEWQRHIDVYDIAQTQYFIYHSWNADMFFDPNGDLVICHMGAYSWVTYPKDGSVITTTGPIKALASTHNTNITSPLSATPNTAVQGPLNIAARTPHLHASTTLKATTNGYPAHMSQNGSNGWLDSHFDKETL